MHYIRHKTIDYMEVAAGIQQRISSYTICGGNVVPHWSIETSTMYCMCFWCSQLKFFLRKLDRKEFKTFPKIFISMSL